MRTKARKVAIVKDGLITNILDYPEASAPVNNIAAGMFDITYAPSELNVGDAFVVDPEDETRGIIPEPFTIISVGSMNKRFTMKEDVALEDSELTVIKVLMRRLFASEYADLEDAELQAGLTAILDYLSNIEDPEDTSVKIVTDVETRLAELLQWGTYDESFKGTL